MIWDFLDELDEFNDVVTIVVGTTLLVSIIFYSCFFTYVIL